jgi:hypothetical protein
MASRKLEMEAIAYHHIFIDIGSARIHSCQTGIDWA